MLAGQLDIRIIIHKQYSGGFSLKCDEKDDISRAGTVWSFKGFRLER